MNKYKLKRGFTIAELLVVIVILASFALLSSFGYNRLKEHQTNEKSRTNAEGVASALDEIYMAGLTSDGAEGSKGAYPSVQEACIADNAVMTQVAQKQKGVDKDVRVAYLSAANPEKFSQDLSGCEVLPSGEISNACAGGSSYPAKLVTCSAAKEELDASKKENVGIIVYQPITNIKASSDYADTSNMSWQCLGEWFKTVSPLGFTIPPVVVALASTRPTPPSAPSNRDIIPSVADSNQLSSVKLANNWDPNDPIDPNLPKQPSDDPVSPPDDPVISKKDRARSGCRGFYVYYLEKSGGKVKLSKAVTGKY